LCVFISTFDKILINISIQFCDFCIFIKEKMEIFLPNSPSAALSGRQSFLHVFSSFVGSEVGIPQRKKRHVKKIVCLTRQQMGNLEEFFSFFPE